MLKKWLIFPTFADFPISPLNDTFYIDESTKDIYTFNFNTEVYDLFYFATIPTSLNFIQINSTYTATLTDDVIECTSGTFTVTLPSAVGNNKKFTIINSGTGVITVEGVDFYEGETLDLISNGTIYVII